MTELANNKITRIEVKGLWGQFDLCWTLEPQVNILSGTNGSALWLLGK